MRVVPTRTGVTLTINAIPHTKAIFVHATGFFCHSLVQNDLQSFPRSFGVVQVALFEFGCQFGWLQSTVLRLFTTAPIFGRQVYIEFAAVAATGLGTFGSDLFQLVANMMNINLIVSLVKVCLLYTSPSPRD